jgi:glycosyltransferase involved in cell wall biosynthesis
LKNKSKHIILLTPGFPQNEEDSTAIPALQIYVKALKECNPNFNIKIITFQYPFTSKKYDWFGVPVFPLNGRNKKYKKFFVWNKANRLLEKINQEKPVDIIHSFWLGECALVGQKFAQTQNIKYLVTAMGQDVNKNLFLRFFLNKSINNSQIITLSKTHKGLLHKNHALESTIISWGINPENFPKQQEKTIDILGVGSLVKIKNFSLFIKIIAKLKKQIGNLNVEIIGNGNLKMQLRNEISEHDLEHIIILNDELPRNEVLIKMAKTKILLHTSSYESFGMVFLEALQSAMKIVSFKVGFAKNSDNWYVCKTEGQMVEKLYNTLQNFQINITESIYTINETVQKYSNIYNE